MSSMDDQNDIDAPFEESFSDKFSRKFAADPFVPIGCVMTAGILGTGLYTFSRGSKFSKQSQMAMRARVIAQGATVVMLMVGTLAYNREKDTVKRRMTLKENEMIRHFQAKAAERDTLGNGARERLQGAKP